MGKDQNFELFQRTLREMRLKNPYTYLCLPKIFNIVYYFVRVRVKFRVLRHEKKDGSTAGTTRGDERVMSFKMNFYNKTFSNVFSLTLCIRNISFLIL